MGRCSSGGRIRTCDLRVMRGAGTVSHVSSMLPLRRCSPARGTTVESGTTAGARKSRGVIWALMPTTNGSAFNATASVGTSSAVSGEITKSPASSRRTGPSPLARTSSFERLAQLVFRSGYRAGGIDGFTDQLAELRPVQHPLLRCQQVCRRIGVAPGARHVHITGAQPIPQRQQRAQLPVVPICAGIAGLRRSVQVAAPPRGHEPVRCAAGARDVELAQDLHRFQQLGRGGAACESAPPRAPAG